MPSFDNALFKKTTEAAGDTSTRLIAARTGLDPAHVSRLLRGHTEPKMPTVRRIARAYGQSLDDYYDDGQAA